MEPVECKSDMDCKNLKEGPYCMDDSTKTPPYYCKGEGLPVADCALGDFSAIKPGKRKRSDHGEMRE